MQTVVSLLAAEVLMWSLQIYGMGKSSRSSKDLMENHSSSLAAKRASISSVSAWMVQSFHNERSRKKSQCLLNLHGPFKSSSRCPLSCQKHVSCQHYTRS